MAKAPKTAYVCNDCGAEFSRWQGQCSACKAWNTITEVRLISTVKSKNDRFSGYAGETQGKSSKRSLKLVCKKLLVFPVALMN